MYNGLYEIRVSVKTLEEASTLMKLLGQYSFKDVSMVQTSSQSYGHEFERSSAAFGRFNELILSALYKAEARDRKSSVTIENILENLKEIPGGSMVFEGKSEGIVSRTVSMVTSAVLGDKYDWVAYEATEPRRYWLTEKGLAHASIIFGEKGLEAARKV